MSLVVLLGASGSGKSTIARAIEAHRCPLVKVFYFDSVGVPTEREMMEQYGSGENWQRVTTIDWMRKIAEHSKSKSPLLLEGQTRFSFLAEASVAAGGLSYHPLLIDCSDSVRSRRLTLFRNQPELANPDMMNWARFLRREAREEGRTILDTSSLSVAQSVDFVLGCLSS